MPAERSEVKFFFLGELRQLSRLQRNGVPCVARRTLVEAVNGEQRRIDPADHIIVREEDFERTEHLDLAAAGAVVPRAEYRPEIASCKRGLPQGW